MVRTKRRLATGDWQPIESFWPWKRDPHPWAGHVMSINKVTRDAFFPVFIPGILLHLHSLGDKRAYTDKTAAKCLLSCGGLSSQLRLILAMGKDVLPFISLTSMTSSWPKPDGAVCEVSFQISKEEGTSLA